MQLMQTRVDVTRGPRTASAVNNSNGFGDDPKDLVVLGGSKTTTMQEILDGPYRAARQQARQALEDPAFQYRDGLPKEEYREQVMDWVHLLAEKGITQTGFPADVGGKGDLAGSIAQFEMLAHFDLSLLIKTGVQLGLFGGSIEALGTESHHQAYLGKVMSVELPGCFAMTETGHGSNVRGLETTATYDKGRDEWVIQTPTPAAQKEFIGGAATHARMATVFAQLRIGEENHGIHAFLVPLRDERGQALPGVTLSDCGEKEGLNGVDNGRISFDGVRIPRGNLLNKFGDVDAQGDYTSAIANPDKRFFAMIATLVKGRVSVSSAALAAAKSGLTIAVRHGSQRLQFGPDGKPELPLLDYQAHQRRLMPHLATAYALTFAHQDLQQRYAEHQGEDSRALEASANALKAMSTDSTIETLKECRKACGGKGYMAENRLPSLIADTDVFATFEGDNTVLRLRVAESLLKGYARELKDKKIVKAMGMSGVAVHIAGQAIWNAVEHNPVQARKTSREHLTDPKFQVAAFQAREDRLVAGLAKRVKARGGDPTEAFNACQDHALALARAHTERTVLEQFVKAVESTSDPKAKAQLKSLCDLYALSRIEANASWFLEKGILGPAKSEAVRDLVLDLCKEVRTDAVQLVDAFGIPDKCLGAPIALT